MSERKDQTEYSLEEILAEYGSGRREKSAKVLDFPTPEGGGGSLPKGDAPAGEPEEEMAEIVPHTLFHALAARVHTLLRRADHYADHMYDQAEPDEATRKAERYIPGVDKEEIPEQPPRPSALRRPRLVHPDTPAAELAAAYGKGLRDKRRRLGLTLVSGVLSTVVCLEVVDWSALALPGVAADVRLLALLVLCAVSGALCYEVVGRGIASLFRLRPGAETLAAWGWLFTLADTAARLTGSGAEGLPCCPVIVFGLAAALWGDLCHRTGDRFSARVAAQTREPFVVTLDEGKWSGRPAYGKCSAPPTGFGSQLQAEDGAQRGWRIAAPLLFTGCLICAGFTAASRESWSHFLWCASVMLTASASWSATLVYAVPYRRLANRLLQLGAALAGWPGVARCRKGGIVMTDTDLFPTGAVQVMGVKVYGDVTDEKAIAYTATMLRALDCGLTRPFHDLLRSQGAFYREVSGLRHHEGGVTGIIRNHEVLVGTADFMHLMDIALPQGLNVKHAVFCAIDGELAGIFAVKYAMSQTVGPCLSALMQEGVSPVLATRDPNLIPALLGKKFKLPVDRMEFPPVARRLELSAREQDHDQTPVALLGREGLGPYCDAVVGGMRLRRATRWGTLVSVAGGVAGAAVTFYLTYVGATASLSPVSFLAFMALWLVPWRLITGWVDRY